MRESGQLASLLTSFVQSFSALLEPFYGGKSLTDPINTAEARISTSDSSIFF